MGAIGPLLRKFCMLLWDKRQYFRRERIVFIIFIRSVKRVILLDILDILGRSLFSFDKPFGFYLNKKLW